MWKIIGDIYIHTHTYIYIHIYINIYESLAVEQKLTHYK